MPLNRFNFFLVNWIPINHTPTDWIVIIFFSIFFIFALVKNNYTFQTNEYLRLPFNNKYIIIFGKKDFSTFTFTTLFFVAQWLTLSVSIYFLGFFFIQFPPFPFHEIQYNILFFTGLLLSVKLLLQYFILYIFKIKNFGKNYLFNKLSYSNYAGFVLAFCNFISFYIFNNNIYFFCFSLLLFAYIQGIGLFSFIKMNQNDIKPYLFYFILYLCTFEIAPYIFLSFLAENIGRIFSL